MENKETSIEQINDAYKDYYELRAQKLSDLEWSKGLRIFVCGGLTSALVILYFKGVVPVWSQMHWGTIVLSLMLVLSALYLIFQKWFGDRGIVTLMCRQILMIKSNIVAYDPELRTLQNQIQELLKKYGYGK